MISTADPALAVALRAEMINILALVGQNRIILGNAGCWGRRDPISRVDGSPLDAAERGAVTLAHHLGYVTVAPGAGRRRPAALTTTGQWQLDHARADLPASLGPWPLLGV